MGKNGSRQQNGGLLKSIGLESNWRLFENDDRPPNRCLQMISSSIKKTAFVLSDGQKSAPISSFLSYVIVNTTHQWDIVDAVPPIHTMPC